MSTQSSAKQEAKRYEETPEILDKEFFRTVSPLPRWMLFECQLYRDRGGKRERDGIVDIHERFKPNKI